MKLSYPICVYPGDNTYTVEIPDLPGCKVEAETLERAFEIAVDTASRRVLAELEGGKAAPPASDVKEIKADKKKSSFVSMVILDMDAFAEKYGSKAVRKNCTIPAWLNTAAEEANINFSQVLQNALMEKLNITGTSKNLV